MIKAIINADDFGMSEEVNLAIVESFQRGLISNTTIMPNMPGADAAIADAKKNNFFHKVGLHLNLREGTPLTEKIRYETLFCDSDGNFNMSLLRFQRYYLSSKTLKNSTYDALIEEIRAQMKWYIDAGFTQMHVDSHQAVHTWYMLFSAIKPIFDEYHFKSMRKRVIGYTDSIPQKIYRMWINNFIPNRVDYFYDGKTFIERVNQMDENKVYEIMCHPVYIDGKLRDAVSGIEIERIIGCGKIQMVSY